MKSRFRPPIPLLVVAVVLLAIGLAALQVIPALSAALQKNMFITAIPFLAIFISILLVYIGLIVTLSRWLNGWIPVKVYRPLFTLSVVGIVLGGLMMFQPWALVIYRIGFSVLLFSLLSFMVISHITPRPLSLEEMG